MSTSIKSFAAKYPTWESFMSAINSHDEKVSAAAEQDISAVMGEDLSGIISQVRGAGGNRGAGGQYYQVYQDALTNKYYAVMRASHS